MLLHSLDAGRDTMSFEVFGDEGDGAPECPRCGLPVEYDEKGMIDYCPDREGCGWYQTFQGEEL